jgi:hypothetical protein
LLLRIVEGLFDDLKPLAILDPLFLSTFVFVCPKPELPLLFLQISSCFSVAWLARLVKDLGCFKKSEVSVNVGTFSMKSKIICFTFKLEEFTAWIEVLIGVLPTEERGE